MAEPLTDRTTERRGRWIEHWEPDDPAFWAATGQRVARRNLLLSMFAEHIGRAWTTVSAALLLIPTLLYLRSSFAKAMVRVRVAGATA